MGETFDPYHKWLGIPPKDQPPNHYRLLGVDLFEADVDVISNAADQRMMLVKTCAVGPHSEESQRILNEIALAKVRLLDPRKKTEYDGALRRTVRAAPPPPPERSPRLGVSGFGMAPWENALVGSATTEETGPILIPGLPGAPEADNKDARDVRSVATGANRYGLRHDARRQMSPVLIAGAVIVSVGVVLLATILYGYLRDRSHARGSAASQRSTHKAEIGTHAKGPIARDGDSIKSGSASTASQRIAHEPTLGVAKVETPTPQLAPAVPARQVALEPALLERVLTASGPEDVSVERIAGSTGDAKPLIPAPAPKPAVPAPAEPDFTLYCPSKVLWLEGLPPSEQIQRDWPWKRTRFTRLFTIRYRGQLPEQRLLNVNGEPVDPQVTLTRVEPTADTHSKKYKTKKDPPRVYWSADGKSFDLLVNHPGVYTFRASAGIWSGDVTVEVRGLPIGVAMDGKTLIKLFGYPDDKRGYYWAYKRWPGIVISISGDPGSVSRVRWIGDDQIRKDGLPDWERAGLP